MCTYIGGTSCIYIYIFKLDSNPLFASQPASQTQGSLYGISVIPASALLLFNKNETLHKALWISTVPQLTEPPSESIFPNPLLSYLNWAPRGLIFCSTLFNPILPGIIHMSLTIHDHHHDHHQQQHSTVRPRLYFPVNSANTNSLVCRIASTAS